MVSVMFVCLCFLCLFSRTVVSEVCIRNDNISDYNTDSEICCPSGIQARFNDHGQEQDCCSNRTYSLDTQLCCEGSVVQKIADNGRETKCCGGLQYSPDDKSKLCCKGTMYERKDEHIGCCGNESIDSSSHECCTDSSGPLRKHKIYKKKSNMTCCKSEYYNTRTHYCSFQKIVRPIYQRMCGNQAYDERYKKCCNRKLHEKVSEDDPTLGCCGMEIYNKINNKCCSSTIIPATLSCCHNEPYDHRTELCCGDGPVKFTKSSDKCCGTRLYNSEYQGCCGNQPFNTSTHECCLPNGDLIDKASNMKCCGKTSYDSLDYVCCQDRVERKSQKHHDSCCVGQSYSSSTHVCSLGSVESKGKVKCGPSDMNRNRDLCCQGRFYKDAKLEQRKCCGSGIKSYSPAEICCNNAVYQKSDKNKRRCESRKNKISKRQPRNLQDYGICRICKKPTRYFIRSIRANDFDICKRQDISFKAFKVRIVEKESTDSNHQKIILAIEKDLRSMEKHNGEKLQIYLPCNCKMRFTRAILVTDVQDFSNPLRLGDSDVLLPWSKKLKKTVLKQWKKCLTKTNNLFLRNMLEIKSFVEYKVNKITNEERNTL